MASLYRFSKLKEVNHLNLPRLAIPKLEDTHVRYLDSMEPLLKPDAFKKHQALVSDFVKTAGPKLHELIVKEDQQNAKKGGYPFHYIEKVWDFGYLGAGCASPININPCIMVQPRDTRPQAQLAALCVTSLFRWQQKLMAEHMEPDAPNADMSQFQAQFGTARIPRKNEDYLEFYSDSRYVVAIHDGKYFKVDVLTKDGKQVSAKALQAAFQEIIDGYKDVEPFQVGFMSADERNSWARNREELCALPLNKQSFETIDRAMIIVCLENSSPDNDSELCRAGLLYGASRWFDKLQMVVTNNGGLGFCFEHSFSDGVTWARWMTDMWNDIHGFSSPYSPLPRRPEIEEKPQPQLLQWDNQTGLRERIETARKIYQAMENNTALTSLTIPDVSRNVLKKWKLAPDGVVQTAYQLAHIRVHGFSPPTYESCSTRAFFHGRTETIRSATNENRKFCLAMDDPSIDAKTRWQLLQKAAAKHTEIAIACAKAQGVDRHFLALKTKAAELPASSGLNHALFSDPEFIRCRSWRLSTSNLSSPQLQYFCFGPVIPDGYGIGYSIREDCVRMQITDWVNCPTTDNKKFSQALAEAFDDIKKLAKQNTK